MTNLEVEIRKEKQAEVNHRIHDLELSLTIVEEQLQKMRVQLKALRQQISGLTQ
jgi:hypothetical protein